MYYRSIKNLLEGKQCFQLFAQVKKVAINLSDYGEIEIYNYNKNAWKKVAFMFYDKLPSNRVYLTQIRIDGNFRGKNIGEKLIDSINGTIYLHVRKDNTNAIKFYERNKFSKCANMNDIKCINNCYLMVRKIDN